MDSDAEARRPKFDLGRTVMTRAARVALSPKDIKTALVRHARGEWGEVPDEDAELNEAALIDGDRVMSVYTSQGGTKFYVITEWDRSVTTVLLPEDY